MTNHGCSTCFATLGVYEVDMHATLVFREYKGKAVMDGEIPVCAKCGTPNPLPGPSRLYSPEVSEPKKVERKK